MGKYMKGRGAVGTRTRAQTLAQQRGESSFPNLGHELDAAQRLPPPPAPSSYMKLRSRVVHSSCKDPLRKALNSTGERLHVHKPAREHIQSSREEHSRDASAEDQIHAAAKESPLPRKRSLKNAGSLPIRECVMTRNKSRKHEEAEPEFCGENGNLDVRVSSNDSHSHSQSHSKDGQGSASRSRHSSYGGPAALSASSAPSSTEIDAFFQGSEHRERRRFIDSYNFDPKNERPLRGRFEWTSL